MCNFLFLQKLGEGHDTQARAGGKLAAVVDLK